MGIYRGQINLINVDDGFIPEGLVGITQINTYYATSFTSEMPPDDELYTLVLQSGLLQIKPNTGVNLYFKNNTLLASRGGQELDLIVDNSIITGARASWTESMPQADAGSYMWSKTATSYSDDTIHVVYNVSRVGADGEKGDRGEPGEAEIYSLRVNQKEILKFINSQNQTVLSPEKVIISIYKEDQYSELGEKQIVEDLLIENLDFSIYDSNTGVWINIEDDTKEKSLILNENNNFELDLNIIINQAKEDANYHFGNILFSEESVLKIAYFYNPSEQKDKKYSLFSYIDVRYGMNKDMASLKLQANGLVASMQDSKLVFNANGLTVKNGSFIIQNNEEDKLLYADENGNLSLVGNIYANNGYFKGELQGATGTFEGELKAASGTFTGQLQAATGSFSGDISAASGTIGGFEISATRLTSLNLDEKGNPNIILDGQQGLIEVENIILGTGAQIKEYIKIGEQVELRRVATSNDSFIKVVNNNNQEILGLKADGTMNIGYGDNSIIFSGSDGSIISQNYYNGLGWKISNTESIFNDVTVRGSIRASVLEYGETQAIGGALLVRPSSRIIKAELINNNTLLTLEQTEGFNVGDYCRIDVQTQSSLEHRFYQIINIDDKIVTVVGDASGSYGKPIVSFGQKNTNREKNDNVGICINGSLDNSFSTPQSISVFDFDPNTKIITPRIILGKLPNEESIYGYAAGTYGLYAENVLLKGSLVTQTNTGENVTYSGINTVYSGTDSPVSHKYADWFGENNTGEILLWAGAEGTSKDQIENSKFFVDRNGNLFAGSGYFKGTIITDATITASAIETAVLRGCNDKPNEPALSIEDATKGIIFTAIDEEGKSKTVFEVTKDSIVANVPNFTFNSNFSVGGNGSLIVPNLYVIGGNNEIVADTEETIPAIILDKQKIFYTNNFNQNELTGTTRGYIDFASNLSFSPDGVNEILQLSSQEIRANVALYLEDSIKYNELMEYKPVYNQNDILIGYDLYIE